MDQKVKLVLLGFAHLDTTQKSEVLKRLKYYEEHRRLDEEVDKVLKVSLGPLGNPCPCCGRS